MDYKFLGVELVGLIEGWIEDERQGVLNTEPPLSPPYLRPRMLVYLLGMPSRMELQS